MDASPTLLWVELEWKVLEPEWAAKQEYLRSEEEPPVEACAFGVDLSFAFTSRLCTPSFNRTTLSLAATARAFTFSARSLIVWVRSLAADRTVSARWATAVVAFFACCRASFAILVAVRIIYLVRSLHYRHVWQKPFAGIDWKHHRTFV